MNPTEIIDEAIKIYSPTHIFAMFSGGHDSYCATHIISQHPRFDAVVHINTGIGIKETRQFIRDRCKYHDWRLLEYKAIENLTAKGIPDPQIYQEIVLKYGFPGPGQHNRMYARLKERCIRMLIREHKVKYSDKILLITGARKQESKRRMGHTTAIQKDGARIWVAPIVNWLKKDCLQYLDDNELPHNPVVDILHMSGECLCGAFAEKGELALIDIFFPETSKCILELQKKVRQAGFPWNWGEKPPQWFQEVKAGQKFLPLCSSCISNHSDK